MFWMFISKIGYNICISRSEEDILGQQMMEFAGKMKESGMWS